MGKFVLKFGYHLKFCLHFLSWNAFLMFLILEFFSQLLSQKCV